MQSQHWAEGQFVIKGRETQPPVSVIEADDADWVCGKLERIHLQQGWHRAVGIALTRTRHQGGRRDLCEQHAQLERRAPRAEAHHPRVWPVSAKALAIGDAAGALKLATARRPHERSMLAGAQHAPQPLECAYKCLRSTVRDAMP